MTADGLPSVQPQFVGSLDAYLIQAPLFLSVRIIASNMNNRRLAPVSLFDAETLAYGYYFDFWFYRPGRWASGVRILQA